MRAWVVLMSVPLLTFPVRAGQLQDELNHRWTGAWVIITSECVSACNAAYTNNAVHQGRTTGNARFTLPPGELAKVHKVDVKRSRIDVLLDLEVHMLAPFQDGPFQLFEDAACRVELEIDAPRDMIKNRDLPAVENLFASVIVRFPNLQAAMQSELWNGREREPFPHDYDVTLAEHARWKAEQTNQAIQAKMNEAVEEAAAIVAGIRDDDEYARGFAKGAKQVHRIDDCDALLSSSVHTHREHPPRGASKAWQDGFLDGQALAYYLELARKLPRCFVAVP